MQPLEEPANEKLRVDSLQGKCERNHRLGRGTKLAEKPLNELSVGKDAMGIVTPMCDTLPQPPSTHDFCVTHFCCRAGLDKSFRPWLQDKQSQRAAQPRKGSVGGWVGREMLLCRYFSSTLWKGRASFICATMRTRSLVLGRPCGVKAEIVFRAGRRGALSSFTMRGKGIKA